MADSLTLKPGAVPLAELRRIHQAPIRIELEESCRAAVDDAAQTVSDVLSRGEVVYGINTGFGRLAKTRINEADLAILQSNLVLSHATGVGPLLDDAVVRLALGA